MGGLLLDGGSGDRSSLGGRLRIRVTLWESSGCESPGIEVRRVRVFRSSLLGSACVGCFLSKDISSCATDCALIRVS